MFELKRILVATGFSERSAKAEARAAILCRELRLDVLELLNVQCSGLTDMLTNAWKSEADHEMDVITQALQAFRKIEQRLKHDYGVRCRCTVRTGDIVSEVLTASESKSADMIVIGDPDRCVEKLLGTTADKLIRLSKCPVLLVRNEPMDSYREVLVPVDFSPESRHAAKLALRVAPDSHITFLHSFHSWAEGKMRYAGVQEELIHQYRMKYREQARREFNQFIEELGPASQRLSSILQFGWAVPVISAYASKMKPDLIVMGKHSGSRIEEFLIGGVTRRTIDNTTSDMLITPREDPGNDYWYNRTAA